MKLKHAFSYAFWSLTEAALYPLVFLLFSPCIMNQMGELAFGLYMLVNTVISTVSILNFGLHTSTQKTIAASFLSKYSPGEILGCNLFVIIRVQLICIVLAAIVYLLVISPYFISLASYERKSAALCLSLAVLIGGLRIIENLFYNAFKGLMNFNHAAIIFSVSKLLNLSLLVLLLFLNQELPVIILVQLLVIVLFLIVLFQFSKSKIQDLKIKWIPELFKSEINYSKWIWLISITITFTFSLDGYLVASISLKDSGYYGLCDSLFSYIHTAFSVIVAFVFPIMARKAINETDLASYFGFFNLLYLIMFTVLMSVFYWIGPWLISFWLGEKRYIQVSNMFPWFVLFESSLLYTIVPGVFMMVNGKEKKLFYLFFVRALLMLPAIYLVSVYFKTAESIIAIMAFITAVTSFMLQFYIWKQNSVLVKSPIGKWGFVIFLMMLISVWPGLKTVNITGLILLYLTSLYLLFYYKNKFYSILSNSEK